MMTPESLTPNSSPELLPIQKTENLQWDHSPERLAEDGAFLWEEQPLRALEAQDILDREEENTNANKNNDHHLTSPLGVFKRQYAFRRKRNPGGFSASLIPNPINQQDVDLDQPNNLNNILTTNRPIVPEAVALDKIQELDLVLHQQVDRRNREK